MSYPNRPCPKCNRNLKPAGAVTMDDVEMPVYTCDECIVEVDFLGETVEQDLTFCVDQAGRILDPADPDEELRF